MSENFNEIKARSNIVRGENVGVNIVKGENVDGRIDFKGFFGVFSSNIVIFMRTGNMKMLRGEKMQKLNVKTMAEIRAMSSAKPKRKTRKPQYVLSDAERLRLHRQAMLENGEIDEDEIDDIGLDDIDMWDPFIDCGR